MICEFSATTNVLVVSGAVPSLIPAQTEVAFSLNGFINPIEAGYVFNFKISTRVRSGADYYVIDEDTTSLFVTEYASLYDARLDVMNPDAPRAGMIQEVSDMQLDFFLPVPLNAGCKVNVTLPDQYNVEEIARVTTLGDFGNLKNYTVELDTLNIDTVANGFSISACGRDYVGKEGVARI